MGLLDKLWDDVVAGPQPESGLGRLRQKPKLPADVMAELPPDEARRVTQSIAIGKPAPLHVDSADGGSSPSTPTGSTPTFSSSVGSPSIMDREKYLSRGLSSPALGSPGGRDGDNVWRSVFNPGSNRQVMRKLGSEKFDKHVPNSPTVYDWLYSKDTKSSWR